MTIEIKKQIQQCIYIQNLAYTAIANELQKRPSFNSKTVSIAYCDTLVCKDLDELYEKRHFNYSASLSSFSPNPGEIIPLGFCLYYDKLPVAYVLGDISIERKAFEIHFTEASNFYGNTGLKGWIKYIISILIGLKEVFAGTNGMIIDNIVFINPVHDTIEPLTQIGFDFINNYHKADDAAIYKLSKD